MSETAPIYKAYILRAAFGPTANEAKVYNMQQLDEICQRLAESEEALRVLRANGHGKAGMTLVEVVRGIPVYARGVLNELFRRAEPAPQLRLHPDPAELHDIWSSRNG